MSNVFNLNQDSNIEISDGFIRINTSIGSTDIYYEDKFSLKELSECIRTMISNPQKWNGKFNSHLDSDLKIAIEFLEEDDANLIFILPGIFITIAMKKSRLPNLVQFFFDNS